MAARISISEAFDRGNIEFVKTKKNCSTVLLHIKSDPYTELEKTSHSQHFYFRSTVSTVDKPLTVKYVLENASETSYAKAWHGYTVFFSKTPSPTLGLASSTLPPTKMDN